MTWPHQKASALPGWSYARFLGVPDFELALPEIAEAAKYGDAAKVSQHPFFRLTHEKPSLLKVWAEQELITSSCFSQVITEWMATIDNCHIRTLVFPVLQGEHGRMSGHIAKRSHPYLAEKLCRSLGSDLNAISALEPTQNFIELMEESSETPLSGAGFLGIGNERMLIEEYGAVRDAFQVAWPTADFEDFLDANILDDIEHHQLIERAASALVSLGGDASTFLDHAIRGVDARMSYYDDLVRLLS
jgi:hypothetical protein